MHRDKLLNQLKAYLPKDATEDQIRSRMISFVQTNPDCFHRHLTIGHITGSTWLLSHDRRRVLLTHHRKLNKWLQLGGHADGDSDILAVALREAREESGIDSIRAVSMEVFDLDIHPIPPHSGEPQHDHYDVRFLCCVEGDDSFKVSDESHELAWVSPEQLQSLDADASVQRMAAKWVATSRANTAIDTTSPTD